MNDIKAYENLANAIIEQAVHDYLVAKKKNYVGKIKEIEKFFHSDMFTMLTNVDPDFLLKELEVKYGNVPKQVSQVKYETTES